MLGIATSRIKSNRRNCSHGRLVTILYTLDLIYIYIYGFTVDPLYIFDLFGWWFAGSTSNRKCPITIHGEYLLFETGLCCFNRNLRLARYDIFVLEEYFEVNGNPEEIYEKLVSHVQLGMVPVSMRDITWLRDPIKLKGEMEQHANQNCLISQEEIHDMDVNASWVPLLSKVEAEKYAEYLQKLKMDSIPTHERDVRGVAISQDPQDYCMWGSASTLPSFTTESTKRLMITHVDRWLCADEKMALTGFPVQKDCLCVWKGFLFFSWEHRGNDIYSWNFVFFGNLNTWVEIP